MSISYALSVIYGIRCLWAGTLSYHITLWDKMVDGNAILSDEIEPGVVCTNSSKGSIFWFCALSSHDSLPRDKGSAKIDTISTNRKLSHPYINVVNYGWHRPWCQILICEIFFLNCPIVWCHVTNYKTQCTL